MKDSELIDQLTQATEGLWWISESDYPFETIYWEDLKEISSEKILEKSARDLATTVEVRELDKFFQRVIEEKDWYQAEEIAECKRYQELLQLLQTHLTDLKVYRVGEVEIDVYILGKTESGAIAGLATISVET